MHIFRLNVAIGLAVLIAAAVQAEEPPPPRPPTVPSPSYAPAATADPIRAEWGAPKPPWRKLASHRRGRWLRCRGAFATCVRRGGGPRAAGDRRLRDGAPPRGMAGGRGDRELRGQQGRRAAGARSRRTLTPAATETAELAGDFPNMPWAMPSTSARSACWMAARSPFATAGTRPTGVSLCGACETPAAGHSAPSAVRDRIRSTRTIFTSTLRRDPSALGARDGWLQGSCALRTTNARERRAV